VIERRVFADPWTEEFFHGELGQSMVYARIAEIAGVVAGYGVAWLGAGTGHLGNLAVAPEVRRRGIARALLEDLLERARALDIERVALEVRGSNFPAQELYRAYGFRVAGLRRGYYRDNGEDALILEWRANT
jgi:ribosomal-protein-alanine N-acetyltransferase